MRRLRSRIPSGYLILKEVIPLLATDNGAPVIDPESRKVVGMSLGNLGLPLLMITSDDLVGRLNNLNLGIRFTAAATR